MDKDELEFENRKKVIDNFKGELKSLMDKYKFGRKEIDQYNGMEEYCGTNIYLTIDGEAWYSQSLSEIVTEIFGEIGEP